LEKGGYQPPICTVELN